MPHKTTTPDFCYGAADNGGKHEPGETCHLCATETPLPDIELVSAAVHDTWMASKRAQGVTSRKAEDGEELMVPYTSLTEKAKALDRGTVETVYTAIRSQSDRPSVQWRGNNLREVIDFTGMHPSADKWTWEEYEAVVRDMGFKLFTPEGSVIVPVGSWIVREHGWTEMDARSGDFVFRVKQPTLEDRLKALAQKWRDEAHISDLSAEACADELDTLSSTPTAHALGESERPTT